MNLKSSKIASATTSILGLVGIAVVLMFQNCGDAGLKLSTETAVSTSSGGSLFYLKPVTESDAQYRAVLFFDMSRSMINAPCIDTSDTWMDGIEAHPDCLGASGVDADPVGAPVGAVPSAKRFRIALTWLNQIQAEIVKGNVRDEQVRVFIAPFSNGEYLEVSTFNNAGSTSYYEIGAQKVDAVTGAITYTNGIAKKLGKLVPSVFLSVVDAKALVLRLWALQIKAQAESLSKVVEFPSEIPAALQAEIGALKNILPTMRTSVPFKALESMNLKISEELAALTFDQRSKTRFEVVFFSDGVPKPHPKHVETIINAVWQTKTVMPNQIYSGSFPVDLKSCVKRCEGFVKAYTESGTVNLPVSEVNPPTPCYLCDPLQTRFVAPKCEECFLALKCYNYSPRSVYGDGTAAYCNGDLFRKDIVGNSAYAGWGDWVSNSHSQIFSKVNTTNNLFTRQFPEVRGRMSFVRIDSPESDKRVAPSELTEDLNWFIKAKKLFSKTHRHTAVLSAAIPFDLFSEIRSGQTYRIGTIYAVNLNSRIGPKGVEIDSDGDGIPDADELAASAGQTTGQTTGGFAPFDPHLARTDGKCLDSIRQRQGSCLSLGCDVQVDTDGDGLNQCEERTLGTDENDFDTDSDRIPDGLEVLFGLNPLSSDQTVDSNSDGVLNFEQFRSGVKPPVAIKAQAATTLVDLQSDFVGVKSVPDVNGKMVSVAGYRLGVNRIPLVNTLAASSGSATYLQETKDPLSKVSNRMLDVSHAAGENHIFVFMRVDNLRNAGDGYWLVRSVDLPYGAKQGLDLSFELFSKPKVIDP